MAVTVLRHRTCYIIGYRTSVVCIFPYGGELILARMIVIETTEKSAEPYAAVVVDIYFAPTNGSSTFRRRGIVFENNFFAFGIHDIQAGEGAYP